MKTPESDRGHQETGLPRVAVVAVHGVATHRPGESARKVADLLVGWKRPPGAGPATDAERQEKPPTQQYTPFLRQSLRIKVRPMELEAPGDAGDADACPDDIAFSRDLLRHHPAKAGADDVYETARFEGSRVGENGQKQATVHVYEMFYDDLAALRGGFRGVFGELYQLLFHLSDLGRDTLARARHCAAPGGEKRAWDLLLGLHRVAAFFLASALPVLSLLLLTLALSVLTVSVPAGFHPALVRGLPVAAVAVGAPFLGWNRWQRRGGGVGSRAWWGVLGAGLLAPMVTYLLAGYLLSRLDTYKALAGEAALFISGGVLAVLAEYGKRRPKALLLARAFLPFTLVAFGLGMAWTEPGATGVARAALWTSEILLLALGASWTLFAFTQLLARVAGLLFAWTRPTPEARNYADRVTYTAAISLLVTSPLLLLLTMAGWLLFGRALEPLVFDPVSEPSLWEMLLEPEPVKRPAPLTAMEYQPVFLSGNQVFFGRAADWLPAQEFLVRVFVAYALPLFPLLPTLGLTLGLLAWALFPSVHAETRTLFGAKDGDSAVARRGGTWLTHGWRLQRYAGELLIVFGGIILLLGPFAGLALSPSVTAQARAALQVVGGTLAASTVGLLALGRRLDALSSWFYPVLDAALDVDKHLRRYPADAPPRTIVPSSTFVSTAPVFFAVSAGTAPASVSPAARPGVRTVRVAPALPRAPGRPGCARLRCGDSGGPQSGQRPHGRPAPSDDGGAAGGGGGDTGGAVAGETRRGGRNPGLPVHHGQPAPTALRPAIPRPVCVGAAPRRAPRAGGAGSAGRARPRPGGAGGGSVGERLPERRLCGAVSVVRRGRRPLGPSRDAATRPGAEPDGDVHRPRWAPALLGCIRARGRRDPRRADRRLRSRGRSRCAAGWGTLRPTAVYGPYLCGIP